MIIYNLNIFRCIIAPVKADSPLCINPDAVLPGTISRKLLQSISGRIAKVSELPGRIEH